MRGGDAVPSFYCRRALAATGELRTRNLGVRGALDGSGSMPRTGRSPERNANRGFERVVVERSVALHERRCRGTTADEPRRYAYGSMP